MAPVTLVSGIPTVCNPFPWNVGFTELLLLRPGQEALSNCLSLSTSYHVVKTQARSLRRGPRNEDLRPDSNDMNESESRCPAPNKYVMTRDPAESSTAASRRCRTRGTSYAVPTFLITETEMINISCFLPLSFEKICYAAIDH